MYCWEFGQWLCEALVYIWIHYHLFWYILDKYLHISLSLSLCLSLVKFELCRWVVLELVSGTDEMLKERPEKGAEIERIVFAKLARDQTGVTEADPRVVTLCPWVSMSDSVWAHCQGGVCTSCIHILLVYKGHGNLLPQGLHWPSLHTPLPPPLSPSPSPPPTHKHHRVCDMVSLPSCSVSQYQHSPPEQINTTWLITVVHALTCSWDLVVSHCAA